MDARTLSAVNWALLAVVLLLIVWDWVDDLGSWMNLVIVVIIVIQIGISMTTRRLKAEGR